MNKWIVAISVILPTLIEVIDTSVVNVSLGHIRGSLSAGLDEATWAITAYLVSNAIVIPMTGWLSRLFGRKRYLIGSIILFTISSFLCGSSKTLAALVFFRILQGIGGGGLQPLSQSILLETFPKAQHGMAMAIFGIGVMFGPIIGPLLGGWITDNWSWNWIFYINIPIGIISVLMVMAFIKDPPYLKRIKAQIDYWGLCLITVGLGCLQVVLDKGQREDWFSSPFIVWFSIVSVISLVLFVIVELRSKEPIVNLRVFRDVSFTSGNCIQAITFFVLFGSIVLLPLYLQQLMGYTAFLAGLALGPGGVATLISMPIAGKLVTRINPKWILVSGLVINATSMFLMSALNLNVDLPIVIWSRVVMGIGMGFVFIPLISMAFSNIPQEEMGNATSVFSLLRNLGGSFGVAFITTLLAVRAQVHQFRFAEHLNPLDLHYRVGLNQAANALMAKGVSSGIAKDGLIYQQLMQKSAMNAYQDTFFVSGVIMVCILPLIFLLNHSKQKAEVLVH